MKKSIAIAFSLLYLTACTANQNSTSSPNPTSTPVTTNATNDSTTLKLLYWQAPTILNPHLSTGFKDSEASRITLDPLASYDQSGKLVLFLAAAEPTVENGGVAKDGKSVTWKLKQNIKWSDGKPFTAADVVFTYQFITNPKVGASTAGTYETIQSVEALDDYTVKINFKEVNPAWYLPFVGLEGMILPKHLFEAYNNEKAREAPANLMAVGTGPFRVVEFKPGDTVVYETNPEYRDANQVFFKRIELKGGGDATSAARAVLQTGEADFAYNLQVEAPVLKQLEKTGKGKVDITASPLMERILINWSDPNNPAPERSSLQNPHPLMSDLKVRQALSYAIDRDTIATQLYGDTGKPTASFIVSPQAFYSPTSRYEFNSDKAKALLDEAGWKDTNGNGIRDKNGVEMKILFQTSVNSLRQKTQEIIKQSLTALGIEVELKSVDAKVFFSGDPANNDTVEKFLADLQMYTTGNTNPDPGSYAKTYTCTEIPQKANNWSGDNVSRYCDRTYDQLWQQSTQELDPEKRRQIFLQMNDKLINDIALIPLVARAEVTGISQQLQGVEMTPWDTRTWKIANWKR